MRSFLMKSPGQKRLIALASILTVVLTVFNPNLSTLAASGPTHKVFFPITINLSSGMGSGTGSPNCIPAQSVADPLYVSGQANMRQIHANDAWANCIQGSPQVVVAVVDGGVDLTHPDLVGNLIQGYNFVENNTTPADDNGHGTHVAGIIAASLNGVGVVGVAPQVKILPVRVMSAGTGTDSTIAAGIRWAADRAQVINLSLGGPSISNVLKDAVNYAIQTKGRVVVAAAGNNGANGNQPEYPAALPGVVAVGAVDGTGAHASFSNTGSYIMLSAPGVKVLSTYLNDQYAQLSGTSMAAPHAAGLAALIWSQNPSATAAQVIAALQSTATDLGAPGWDSTYGYGLIDAYPAAGLALSAQAVSTNAMPSAAAAPAEDRTAPLVISRVLVKLKPGIAVDSLTSTGLPVQVSGEIAGLGVQVLQVPAGQEWSTIDALRKLAGVEYAEPDYMVQTIQ